MTVSPAPSLRAKRCGRGAWLRCSRHDASLLRSGCGQGFPRRGFKGSTEPIPSSIKDSIKDSAVAYPLNLLSEGTRMLQIAAEDNDVDARAAAMASRLAPMTPRGRLTAPATPAAKTATHPAPVDHGGAAIVRRHP